MAARMTDSKNLRPGDSFERDAATGEDYVIRRGGQRVKASEYEALLEEERVAAERSDVARYEQFVVNQPGGGGVLWFTIHGNRRGAIAKYLLYREVVSERQLTELPDEAVESLWRTYRGDRGYLVRCRVELMQGAAADVTDGDTYRGAR